MIAHITVSCRGCADSCRERIRSSRYHPNPFAMSDPEMAWTQPLVIADDTKSQW